MNKEPEISKELQKQLEELARIVKDFRIVGPGISGSFETGYNLDDEVTINPQ